MPAMIQPKGKAKKIADNLLGKKKSRTLSKKSKLDRTLEQENTRYIR